ncbi:MAG: ester cyclase [Caldilineaceae bacterium]
MNTASTDQPSPEIQALLQKHYSGYAADGNPAATFTQTTLPTWSNCGANGAICQTREELIDALANGLHKLIPDMKWEILEMMASGDKVIVRGQGSGTPTGAFMDVPASGKSFQIMSIDIHTFRDGKIAHTYHLEDWGAALGQLSDH